MKITKRGNSAVVALLAVYCGVMAAPGQTQVVDPAQASSGYNGQVSNGSAQSVATQNASNRVLQPSPGAQSSGIPDYRPAQLSVPADAQANANSATADEPQRARRQPPGPPGEFESYVSEIVGKPVRRFGSELLTPEARDYTAPPVVSVPPDYRINPGDEIRLGLTGNVQATNLRLQVDTEGRIFVPEVGAIQVAGVANRDLQAVIGRSVSRQYKDFTASVGVTRLGGITVYVTGFAAVPGSYTVGSLSTVVNAVLAAGGPAAGGSFRSIQVRRGGKLVSDFDFYDFLLKGDKSADVVLQNGDVIFIAPAGTQVAAIGSVNREAIYEARAGDTLKDVLVYAGGVNTVADVRRLHVLDPMSEQGWQELTPEVAGATPAQRGLLLRVLSAVGIAQPAQRLPSLVTVGGEVQKPGRYFVQPGTTLEEVIAKAGGLTDRAYPFGAVFVRDSLRRQQTYNFGKAVDELKVTLTAEPLVRYENQDKDLTARLSAVDALVGQLNGRRIEGRLVLPVAPSDPSLPAGFLVENNDNLVIPTRSLAVGVYGMVNSSADFRFKPGSKVGEYLALAGGFNRLADRKHVFVVRANGTLLSGRKTLSATALPGDLVFVPIDSQRGAFWARFKDLLNFGFQGALATASIVAVTK
ncbi:MAG: SLBB domain-containing protein [Novosphingobium sp.]